MFVQFGVRFIVDATWLIVPRFPTRMKPGRVITPGSPTISRPGSTPGELPVPGARLPGERDLAAEYQVALGETMRRAIEELRSPADSLVTPPPAKGTFVPPRWLGEVAYEVAGALG